MSTSYHSETPLDPPRAPQALVCFVRAVVEFVQPIKAHLRAQRPGLIYRRNHTNVSYRWLVSLELQTLNSQTVESS